MAACGTKGLAVVIVANGVHAAPIGLSAAISTATSLAGTVVETLNRRCRNPRYRHDHFCRRLLSERLSSSLSGPGSMNEPTVPIPF
jgi:hypothetical protein